MKITLSSRKLFILGFVLLILANITVLVGIIVNRSGVPESLIILTERELPTGYQTSEENSGVDLDIDWRTQPKKSDDPNFYYGYYDRSPAWLSQAKLEELGFDVAQKLKEEKDDYYCNVIPKEVFIVLEYDGVAYREVLQQAQAEFAKRKVSFQESNDDEELRRKYKEADRQLKAERGSRTKLFAMDAGLDPDKLRAIYKDRSRYIIAKGLVTFYMQRDKEGVEVSGRIVRLSVEKVHVSCQLRQKLLASAALKGMDRNSRLPAHYRVELAHGNRFEPWIIAFEPTTQGGHSE